jgi:PAS domain S-box-containing protein
MSLSLESTSADTAGLEALTERLAAAEAEARRLKAALEARAAVEDQRAGWMRRIADAMPVLISYVDREQRFRFCNKAYETRFGRPLSEIVGRTCREVMGEEVYEARRPYIERALAGEAVTYRTPFPHPTGRLDTVVEHMPQRGADGEVLGFFSLVQDVTEIVRAEAALRESEARLRTLTDNLPGVMIYQVATSRDMRERRYTYVSANCERFVGLTPEQVLSDPTALVGLIDPEQWPGVFEAELTAAATLTTLDVEVSGRLPGGRFVRSRIISNPREGLDGSLLWDGIVVDTTERHMAEGALSESESRFRRIADSAPAPMWVTAIDRTREFCNQAYVDFVGVPYQAALAFDWRTIIHPDDAPRIYREQLEKESSLRPFSLEARYRRADGEWRWLRSESQPRFGADGAHTGFIGVAYDITDAKQAQADLERLNELLETRVIERTAELERLYREAPVPLFATDLEGRIISVSDRWLEFMGHADRRSVVNHHAGEFLTEESRAWHLANRSVMLEAGAADDVEYQVVKADGEVAEVLVSSRVTRDAEGRFLRIMSAMVDVTARKRAEEQLRQAQKMEAVGQLTGGVAHDFNNLLTPIIGSLDLLRRRVRDDARSTRLLDAATQGAERAATLVQRLLAFARRQELRPQPTDVPRLVEGMRDLIERTLGPQITVETHAAPDTPAAMVDANQLELALLNLAVNARDAMPEGGTLRIETDAAVWPGDGDLPGGDYVRLAVVDTGAGMDSATLARAVEPFFSTKRVGEGTGLGLSMVHGLAAQSGGRLALQSRPGEGVRAELWLPAAQAAASPDEAGRSCLVLLVDDEDLVREVAASMLAELGCEVLEAAGAGEALALLRTRPEIEALITDQLMPDMRGAELVRRARDLRPELPVLLITGYADEAAGLDPLLPRLDKPFRQADLEDWLAVWRSAATPASA